MRLLVAANSNFILHYFAGKYPDKIGTIYSPSYWGIPKVMYYMTYALDNGCYTKWEPELYFEMLEDSKNYHAPLWVTVPDVVGDYKATLDLWEEYKEQIKKYKYNLAFVCQDGCNPEDVPEDAHCCFIGGTTDWKLNNAHRFKGVRELFHIGRVNTKNRLDWAESLGADSVDGSGWLRAKGKQYKDFINYFENNSINNKLW